MKRKIKLPTDRNGIPINVDDVLMWDDGFGKVCSLGYYGEVEGEHLWVAMDENGDELSDNLGAAINVKALVKKKGKQ